MTDTPQQAKPDFPVPSFVDQIVRALAQKGLTALATYLTAHALLTSNHQDELVTWGVPVAAWAASFAWTWVHERMAHRTTVAALNAEPPTPPVPVNP